MATLPVGLAEGVETGPLRFDRAATPSHVDAELGHSVYTLQPPLQPGEALQLGFEVRFAPRGFTHGQAEDRKSTRLNSSHANISYAVFCLKKKKNKSPNNTCLIFRTTRILI